MPIRPLALVAPLVAVLTLGSSQALANPTCGAVLTQDTTLDGDLSCSLPDGTAALVIGKRGITLNLEQHTLDGDGSFGSLGVSSTAGAATITNGSIQEFGEGVRLGPRASRNVVTGLLITSGVNGVSVSSRGNEISGNQIQFNLLDGILLGGSSGNVISGNALVGNGQASISDCSSSTSAAISLSSGSNANTIGPDNTSAETCGDGFLVRPGSSRNVITGNVSGDNSGDGFDIQSPKTTLTGNSATNNVDYGIFAVAGVTDGGSNTASGNGTDCTSNISC